MKNKLYGATWILLVLFSQRTDAMETNRNPFYRFDKSLPENYFEYQRAINRRFDQNRPCYPFTPFVETAADFSPLLAAVLVPTGLTNKLVNAIPLLDASTKDKVASSLNKALILNLLPAAYRVAKPIRKGKTTMYSLYQSSAIMQNPGLLEVDKVCGKKCWAYVEFPYEQSPIIIPTIAFVGTYVAADLVAQSETVATAVDKIPYAMEAKQLWNEHAEPGSGTAIAQLALFLTATYMRSKV